LRKILQRHEEREKKRASGNIAGEISESIPMMQAKWNSMPQAVRTRAIARYEKDRGWKHMVVHNVNSYVNSA
jgi:hypothetical protein